MEDGICRQSLLETRIEARRRYAMRDREKVHRGSTRLSVKVHAYTLSQLVPERAPISLV